MRSCSLMLALALLTPISSSAQPSSDTTKVVSIIELTMSATIRNSYARGNLDDWWSEGTGDPTRKVDQGSPSFFAFSGRWLTPLTPGKSWLSAGVGIVLGNERGLWGSQIVYGGFQRLVLRPMIISLTMEGIFNVESMEGLSWEAGGGLLVGWVSGEYLTSTVSWDMTPGPGLGFTVGGGANYMLTERFGLSARAGLRFLKVNLVGRDADSPTGFSQFLLDNDDKVKASLSGFYLTVGVTFRMPRQGPSKR